MKVKLIQPLHPGWPGYDLTCDPVLVEGGDRGLRVVVMGNSEALLFANGAVTYSTVDYVRNNYKFIRKLEPGESFTVEV